MEFIAKLPLLPTMGIGSAAAPGWLYASRRMAREGAFGPADIEELYDDATRLAVRDQIEAGLDVISDGELRRQRFVYEMYDRLGGLTRVPSPRKLGVAGYDQAPHFRAEEAVGAPAGLGIVAEYRALQAMAPGRVLKAAFPGALTFALAIEAGRPGRTALVDQLIALVRAEIAGLIEAGCAFIQLDEPVLAAPPLGLTQAEAAEIINRTTAGHAGRIAVHVCFGNNAGRPLTPRSLSALMPAMRVLDCAMLVLEFANREMADLDVLSELSRSHLIGVGVIDVKSFHCETPGEVAERLERVLRHAPAERLLATADCGYSALPRGLARAKMVALVAGAAALRGDGVRR